MSYELENLEKSLYQSPPLDEAIRGGVAWYGYLTEDLNEQILRRQEELFLEIRTDSTRQFGGCIAYLFDAPEEDRKLLSKQLVESAGLISSRVTSSDAVAESVRVLWQADIGDRVVSMRLAKATIVLANGMAPDADLYSLTAVKTETAS